MTQLVPPPINQLPDSPQLKPEGRRIPKPLLVIPIGLAIAAIGYGVWRLMPHPEPTTLHLSGRIEGYETDIGAKTGGRVNFIAVREGDEVKKGQVLVRINDEEIQAQLRGATANITSAQQQAQQAQSQIDGIDSKIREAELNLKQSKGDATGRISQAQSTVSAANAQLAEAIAQVKQAEAQVRQAQSSQRFAATDRDRYAQLVSQGAVNRQQFDQAQTAFETAQASVETAQATLLARRASVDAARDQLSAAKGGFTQVQTTGINPDIRGAQLSGFYQQRQQAVAQLKQAQAQIKTAQEKQKEIQAQLNYLNVTSPIAGVVTARPIEPGAVVAPGKTMLTVMDLTSVYLRGYVPEGEIGKVRVGQPAKIFLDSNPSQGLTAKVSAIDPKASFTPENIYFRNDRVNQVFGVKLTINDTKGFAKPGMPADGEITLETK
ncbi:hypothetical protein C7B65_15545 [Phormidesmis priestleyi ULC007]|uniref:Uncharacterized protein n=1 Tax=Phormidesmis priestleyi ULC007 TaxID=1920490 RepID=A0A2T1DCQ7_9CYAN|nr:efflux RND transporter periplasmic adaptor subunit [Phormidesmis priestleyi]PSB18312.1 hypothetical protein C7B65_15545 [Phormidesmis priestleyi ULC007]PZO46532.1 MAG: hypothetical protein DCF14_22515 [Phormidesmis priestleyi]